MAKRIKSTKVGDVFAVPINEKEKKYMQYIISDLYMLNSDVVRAFKKVYPIESNPDLEEIVRDEVEFYAHCVTKAGIKLGLWELVGNLPNVGDTSSIIFRDTFDYGRKAGEERVKVSDNWYIWHINDENYTHVGKLVGENRNSHIGLVFPPSRILERLRTGRYSGYPDFK